MTLAGSAALLMLVTRSIRGIVRNVEKRSSSTLIA
jgi:hypothetical protein